MADDKKTYNKERAQMQMLEVVKELRGDKEKYQELKNKIRDVKSEEDRADILIDFVTRDERLGQLLGGGANAAAITTVTITTVIIIVPSAY